MRNNIAATETPSNLDGSEHIPKIHTHKPMSITNVYCPNTKKLNLNTIPISDTDHLVVGVLTTTHQTGDTQKCTTDENMLKNEKNDTIHRGCTVIEENGKTYTGKHAANVLAEDFATDSKITIPVERSRNNTNAQEKQTQKQLKPTTCQ